MNWCMKTASDASACLEYTCHIFHINQYCVLFSSIGSDLYLQIQLQCRYFRNTPTLNGHPELKPKSFCDERPDPRTPLTPLSIHVTFMCVPAHLKIPVFGLFWGGVRRPRIGNEHQKAAPEVDHDAETIDNYRFANPHHGKCVSVKAGALAVGRAR